MNAKVAIKSESITSFGGIFYVMDEFDKILCRKIDSELGMRCKYYGYQYSEIFRSLFSIYLCGGNSIEDINAYLKEDLSKRPFTRIPSSDTILKGIRELSTPNIEYISDRGNSYSFNPALKLNDLMVKLLLATGQLEKDTEYTVDFDHQFIETEKFDSRGTYKHFKGYGPGVSTINGLPVHIENRDGNANVRFMQEDTLERMFTNLEANDVKVKRFRADCGSYTEKVINCALKYSDHIYIRAERCASLYGKIKKHEDWEKVEINYGQYEVRSFPFDSFDGIKHCRLVVQRQRKKADEELDLFDGEYTYRCILTNDWEMTDKEIILFYNERGTCERVFDQMNNDFGWNALPKSFMNENAVFLLMTAMAHNFYQYLIRRPLMKRFGVEKTSRVKKFIFRFIAVPAKWIKTARQYILNYYTDKPYDILFALE